MTVSRIQTITIQILYEDVCSSMEVRPGTTIRVPSTTIELDGRQLTATRHHIIPYSVLRDFFNAALLKAQFLDELGYFVNGQLRQIYAQVEQNPNIGLQRNRNVPNTDDLRLTRAVEITQRMQAVFVWMPGNLFYGPAPNLRSDDPGNEIETNAGAIIGAANYAVLDQLHTDMKNFIKNPSTQTIGSFNRIIANINVVGNKQEAYAFQSNQWEKVDNKFNIKLNTPFTRSATAKDVSDEVEENPYQAAYEICQAAEQRIVPKGL